jgi:hypothetical protein
MDFDEAALLRDVRRVLEQFATLNQEALAERVREVLARHGASQDDLSRLLSQAARQRRSGELASLAGHIGQLAEHREDQSETSASVDAFLRSLDRKGGP